jgi:FAD/FMN-containing dehydrogenase
VKASEWRALEQAIDGSVVPQDSPGYERVHKPDVDLFNARFDNVEPEAAVSCANPNDVSETLAFVRRHSLAFAVRAGGHSFAGHSTTRGVLVDVGPMRSVSVSAGLVTVGPGATLGEVYGALDEHALAIPGGTCPPVGVAGLTLGGGLGILGRSHGVTSDSLVGAEIVLADGRLVLCDEHHDEDLFWALRGAGTGNIGVVTSLVFRPVPAPEATNLHLSWPFADAAAVIDAWQTWAPDGPDELAASLKVTATGDAEPPSVDVYAAVMAGESDAEGLLAELVSRADAEPVSSTAERLSFERTRRYWAALGEDDPAAAQMPTTPERIRLYARSEFFRQRIVPEAVAALLDEFARDRKVGEYRELDFMPWAGAYNRVPPDATAFVHRQERFQLKHAVIIEADASPDMRVAARAQVNRSWGSVHPWGSGRVFQNFADPDLDDWPQAYYGPNLARLMRVHERYDPDNVFRSEQSLGSLR